MANTGPPKCTLGQNISVSINMNITMTTGANRYDLGAYFGLNGADAKLSPQKDACLVQYLGNDTVATAGSVSKLDEDECWDTDGKTEFVWPATLTTQCAPEISGLVELSICFAWKTTQNDNCFTQSGASCSGSPNITLHNTCLIPKPNSVSSFSHPLFIEALI